MIYDNFESLVGNKLGQTLTSVSHWLLLNFETFQPATPLSLTLWLLLNWLDIWFCTEHMQDRCFLRRLWLELFRNVKVWYKIQSVVTVRGAPSTITLGTWRQLRQEVEQGRLRRSPVLCHNIWEQDVSTGTSVTRPADCRGLIKRSIKHLAAPSGFDRSFNKSHVS